MTRIHSRRVGVLLVAVTSLALVGASCASGGGFGQYYGPPVVNNSFRGTSVTVIDQTEFTFLVNRYDEPYLVNIHARVAFNDPNSASAGAISTRSFSPEIAVCKVANQGGFGNCDPGTETAALTAGPGGSGAENTDTNIAVLDLIDVLYGQNKLAVTLNWVWAMEEDLIGNPLPGSLATILTNVLNSTIAAGTIPDFNNAQAIVDLIFDDLGDAIGLGAAALANALIGLIPWVGDDLLGSRMYVRVGAYGGLGALIDAASVNVAGIQLNLTAIGVPNILGATVRGMASGHSYPNQVFNGSGFDYRYDFVDG